MTNIFRSLLIALTIITTNVFPSFSSISSYPSSNGTEKRYLKSELLKKRLDNHMHPKPLYAENGSYYGELSANTGKRKTVHVRGYYRRDGTYVRGHYRSK